MSNVGKRGKLKLESRLRAALLKGTNTRLEHHEIERVIDALLKPPAREDAQPVAVIAFREGRREPELLSWRALPFGEHQLYTHPAPDALRAAVEALEKIKAVRVCKESANIWTGVDACRKIATKALAALQAEQGAK